MTLRKQYHFRPGESGLQAWDVGKLIHDSCDLPIIKLPLSEIAELDETYWYDPGEERPTCRSIAGHMRLVQDADLAWPVIICPAGRVMDGMHRIVKALLLGETHVPARRLPVLPPPDFIGVKPEELTY